MSSHPPQECEFNQSGCTGNTGPVWYCVDCSFHLCEPCWSKFPTHQEGRTNRDGRPHEKVKYHIYKKLQSILEPNYSESDLEDLHQRDLDTTWFGIRKDNTGQPLLADYDVYSTLLGSPLRNGKEKYPQLVSFIGQTNAGKSTLIKMLIQLHEHNEDVHASTFPSPVVGLPHLGNRTGEEGQNRIPMEHIPTSADVHLYADPVRFKKQTPLLYADCEGLTGGENLPVGAQENRTSLFTTESSIARLTPGRLRPLAWADTERRRTRGFFVKQMYPRILYTLSDVVVFVVPDANTRTFEVTTLRPLLEWADTSLETSINQPTLPHAIIVVNGSDPSSSNNAWDSEAATQSLLEANKHCLERGRGHHYFISLADKWRSRGKLKDSDTLLDLIHCYYSTFKVIRIPRKGRFQLLNSQIESLHEMVTTSCKLSFGAKGMANMLCKSHELHIYFQSAFDHFANTLDRPFNFIAVSLLNNPIPNDFGGHILQLAITIQTQDRQRHPSWIFDQLIKLVACSVLLDCVRHRKGSPEDLFLHYEHYCSYAIDQFWHRRAPCEFQLGAEYCVNVSSNHDPKGHQNAKGKIIAAGEFVSSFQPVKYFPRWRDRIKAAIRRFNQDLQSASRGFPDSSKEDCLLRIHSNIMHRFYIAIGSAGHYLSHATCFCCLMHSPQHALRCGHVLCTQCVRAYGQSLSGDTNSKNVISLDCCPLHPAETKPRWRTPCIIRFKPEYAGVRLLCLDGGGMRGIVELEVLRAIQNQIGNRVPVQAFFDLIVGTSTGGIIALAFGVKNWSIKRCADRFRRLCGAAFTPRLMQAIPLLKYVLALKLASKYHTKPLRRALKSTLGEQPLFGSEGRRRSNHSAKIAVTATDQAGTRAIVIANYSRQKDGTSIEKRRGDYEFLRPDDPSQELKVWEAAAATSAAPSYFKPFEHTTTKRTYLDGAIYHNNPVRLLHRERKILWPDVAHRDPDILLSIGTSQNGVMSEFPSTRNDPRLISMETEINTRSKARAFPRMRQMFATMHNRIDSILDAELAWREFCKDTANVDDTSGELSRYVRINPNIGRDPPSLDDMTQFKRLQQDVRIGLRSADDRAQVTTVAHMLIASSFYYERDGEPKSETDGTFTCTGQIYCRFEDSSPYLRGLGDFFMNQQTRNFCPYFELSSELGGTQNITSPIDVASMREMASFRIFTPTIRTRKRDEVVSILLHLRSPDLPPSKYQISGFPRVIMEDSQVQTPVNETPTATSPTWVVGELPTMSNVSELDGTPAHPNVFNRAVSEQNSRSIRGSHNKDRSRRNSTGTISQNRVSSAPQSAEIYATNQRVSQKNRLHSMQRNQSLHPSPTPTKNLTKSKLISRNGSLSHQPETKRHLPSSTASKTHQAGRADSPQRPKASTKVPQRSTASEHDDHSRYAVPRMNFSPSSPISPTWASSDPQMEAQIRAEVTSFVGELNRSAELSVRQLQTQQITLEAPVSRSSRLDGRNHTSSQTSRQANAPASQGSSRINTSNGANTREFQTRIPTNSSERQTSCLRPAAEQHGHITPSPASQHSNFLSLDQQLHSMSSETSIASEIQTVDTHSALSTTPNSCDTYRGQGNLSRSQWRQIRPVASTAFSDGDDDRSDISAMSNLGRRNV